MASQQMPSPNTPSVSEDVRAAQTMRDRAIRVADEAARVACARASALRAAQEARAETLREVTIQRAEALRALSAQEDEAVREATASRSAAINSASVAYEEAIRQAEQRYVRQLQETEGEASAASEIAFSQAVAAAEAAHAQALRIASENEQSAAQRAQRLRDLATQHANAVHDAAVARAEALRRAVNSYDLALRDAAAVRTQALSEVTREQDALFKQAETLYVEHLRRLDETLPVDEGMAGQRSAGLDEVDQLFQPRASRSQYLTTHSAAPLTDPLGDTSDLSTPLTEPASLDLGEAITAPSMMPSQRGVAEEGLSEAEFVTTPMDAEPPEMEPRTWPARRPLEPVGE